MAVAVPVCPDGKLASAHQPRLEDVHRGPVARVERRAGEVEQAHPGVEHDDEHQRPPGALPERRRRSPARPGRQARDRLAEQGPAVGDVGEAARALVDEPAVRRRSRRASCDSSGCVSTQPTATTTAQSTANAEHEQDERPAERSPGGRGEPARRGHAPDCRAGPLRAVFTARGDLASRDARQEIGRAPDRRPGPGLGLDSRPGCAYYGMRRMMRNKTMVGGHDGPAARRTPATRCCRRPRSRTSSSSTSPSTAPSP